MTYHFIGLGGIGMSALARILLQKGSRVQGSDMAESELLLELQKEGAMIHIGHRAESIDAASKIIYSSSVQEDNVEWMAAKEKELPLLHRSDLLHELMQDKKAILIGGSHGKTTTSALASWLLEVAKMDPSFVVGGIVRSLSTNAKAGEGEYFVAEADESDGSFLKSRSFISIVTSLSNDHLDYWKTETQLDAAFSQYMKNTEHLIWCADDARLSALNPQGISYGFSEKANWKLSRFRQDPDGVCFDLNEHKEIRLKLSGRHNALNAASVFIVGLMLNIPLEKIREALKTFEGTQRRLERIGEKHTVAVYDDYGHHPREISATLSALRGKIKEKRLVVIFQPHRYSRVQHLFEEFTDCFSDADEVFLTDIYSAGEKPIDGVSSAALYTRMREKLGAKLHFLPRSYLESAVANQLKPFDVVLTLGAGDVTKVGKVLLDLFSERAPKIKCALLFGGASSEHEVSLQSMQNVLKALSPDLYDVKPIGITKEGQWVHGYDLKTKAQGWNLSQQVIEELKSCDVCIPIVHGQNCEDGLVAAVLDALSIPYVGCDYKSAAICMHKTWSKYAALSHGIPTADFVEVRIGFEQIEKIEEKIGYPLWVKPAGLGSSIGVHRVTNRDELISALQLAHSLDEHVLCEKEIIGRQIEFALFGNEYVRVASGEIVSEGAFVGYEQKYGEKALPILAPARLTKEEEESGKQMAETLYLALGCKGLSRVDFFLDESGQFWFNEINPMPGLTDTSAYPHIWKEQGYNMSALINECVMLAFHRFRHAAHRAKLL